MINRWLLLMIMIFTAIFGHWNRVSAEIVDRIVAVVNDDIISLYELNEALEPYFQRIKSLGYPPEKERQMMFKVREEILQKLIDQKLTDQQIAKSGITVSDQEVDAALEKIKEANFITDEQLRAELAREGISFEDYRNRIKEQIQRNKLVTLEVQSRIVITREDVEAYYQQHMGKKSGKTQYHIRTIAKKLPPGADSQKIETIRQQMDAIYRQLEQGMDFKQLARTHSDFLAEEAGDLGLFDLESMAPKLREQITQMKPGQYTPVMKTDIGFQIYYLEQVTTDRDRNLEKSYKEIEQKLYNEIVNQKYREWLKTLRKTSHIRIIQ